MAQPYCYMTLKLYIMRKDERFSDTPKFGDHLTQTPIRELKKLFGGGRANHCCGLVYGLVGRTQETAMSVIPVVFRTLSPSALRFALSTSVYFPTGLCPAPEFRLEVRPTHP